ncbi:hypothetical protein BDW66DRAFT_136289 [Aspergillus desertorum]
MKNLLQRFLRRFFVAAGGGTWRLQRVVKPRDEIRRVLAQPLHTNLQGSQAPDAEPALHISHYTTKKYAVPEQLLSPLLVLRGENSTQDIAVSPKVLGPRVHHQVSTKREWVLQRWRRKRRVDYEIRAPRVRLLCVLLNIERGPFRVDRSFQVYNIPSFQLLGWAIQFQLLEPI